MIAELLQRGGLSLDRLQSFCRVAEAGGVTKAAKGDATKQSLFSRQIKELEQYFEVELIRRKGRGVVLTAAGERLHLIVREQFSVLTDFKNECQQQPLELSVGAGESFIEWLLLPRFGSIRQKLPEVRLKFLNLTTSETVKRLTDGMVDFGIVRTEAVTRTLESISLGTLQYSLFLPAALRGQIGTEQKLRSTLSWIPFATLEGEGWFRQELRVFENKLKVQLNTQIECSSFPLVARAVQSGTVAAILPGIAALELPSAKVAEVRHQMLQRLEREISLAWNPRMAKVRSIINKGGKLFGSEWRIS